MKVAMRADDAAGLATQIGKLLKRKKVPVSEVKARKKTIAQFLTANDGRAAERSVEAMLRQSEKAEGNGRTTPALTHHA